MSYLLENPSLDKIQNYYRKLNGLTAYIKTGFVREERIKNEKK
jgi:hypothetical protein